MSVLVFSGSTVWDLIGRMKNKIKGIIPPTADELLVLETSIPKVYNPTAHLLLSHAITHCSAYHSVLIDGTLGLI